MRAVSVKKTDRVVSTDFIGTPSSPALALLFPFALNSKPRHLRTRRTNPKRLMAKCRRLFVSHFAKVERR